MGKYVNVASLCCTPETNIILCISYALKINSMESYKHIVKWQAFTQTSVFISKVLPLPSFFNFSHLSPAISTAKSYLGKMASAEHQRTKEPVIPCRIWKKRKNLFVLPTQVLLWAFDACNSNKKWSLQCFQNHLDLSLCSSAPWDEWD